MANPVWGYIKCVISNKPLFLGYAFTLIGLNGNYLEDHLNIDSNLEIMLLPGLTLLMMSNFGIKSYGFYRKTLKHIEANGEITEAYRHRHYRMGMYCDRAGLRVAAKEKGLEYKIKKKKR